MDLPRFLGVVRAHRWLIIGVAIAAAGLAFALSVSRPDRFRASADLLFGRATPAGAVVAGAASGSSEGPERAAATNLALASLDTVAARVKRTFKAPATIAALKGAVTVQPQGQSDLVTVTAEWSTPALAASLANSFADQIVALRRETAQTEFQRAIDAVQSKITAEEAAAAASPRVAVSNAPQLAALRGQLAQLEILKRVQTGDVEVIERAAPPEGRSAPTPTRNAIIAGLAGLILALFVVVLLARFDERIHDEEELTELMGAPVLARIPEVSRSKRLAHTFTPHQDAFFIEAFQFLRLNLQLMGSERGTLAVAVTSPLDRDGKSTVVGWLAHALALSRAEVVAVDFDLRNPQLHTYFDVSREPGEGVLDALLHSDNPEELTQSTALPGLRVLTGGDHPGLPTGSIAQGRLYHLLAKLRDTADYVLIDTSPVTMVADASAVAAAADGVILVIDLDRIRRRELLGAKKQLAHARANILGIVLNRAAGDSPARAYHPPAEPRAVEPRAPTRA